MSEYIPSQSEDPLPITGEYSYGYNKEPKSTLGEVVVTDERDPFVWLQSEVSKIHEMPSKDGKQVLWFMYRMNGSLPASDQDAKWRDESTDIDTVFARLSRTDMACVERYMAHLAHMDAEEALTNEDLIPQPESATPKLHEANSELVLAAIMQHLDIIRANTQSSEQ